MERNSDPYSDRIVADLLGLCISELAASFAMMFWFDEDANLVSPESAAMPHDLLPFYNNHVGTLDPLHVFYLAKSKRPVNSLHGQAENVIGRCHRAYLDYLDRFDIHDELDLVFWRGERPVGGLALFRSRSIGCFAMDDHDWDRIHRHLDCSLQMHKRVRDFNLGQLLSKRYRLRASEVDVVQAMMTGATNNEIAEQLDLKPSTVKSYVFSIFDKIGVDNRASLIAALSNSAFL